MITLANFIKLYLDLANTLTCRRDALQRNGLSKPASVIIAFVGLQLLVSLPGAAQSLSDRVAKLEDLNALTARGVVMPNAEVTFSSEIAAPITELPVKAGDTFNKGAKLVRFDCGKYDAELRGSMAIEGKQLLILNNRKKLKQRNAASSFEVAEASADYQSAKAQVDALKQILRFCLIRAPFNGRVLELHADRYEMPSANQPLLTVVDDSILELDLIVPSKWLRWLTIGTGFSFDVDETGKSYGAKIVRLGAKIDAVSQTIKITGVFDQRPERVLPGMSGAAHFNLPTQ